LGIILII